MDQISMTRNDRWLKIAALQGARGVRKEVCATNMSGKTDERNQDLRQEPK